MEHLSFLETPTKLFPLGLTSQLIENRPDASARRTLRSCGCISDSFPDKCHRKFLLFSLHKISSPVLLTLAILPANRPRLPACQSEKKHHSLVLNQPVVFRYWGRGVKATIASVTRTETKVALSLVTKPTVDCDDQGLHLLVLWSVAITFEK